jgi:hypothetical protein
MSSFFIISNQKGKEGINELTNFLFMFLARLPNSISKFVIIINERIQNKKTIRFNFNLRFMDMVAFNASLNNY